jgi:hypothetical protein
MIEQTGVLGATIQNERIYRESPATEGNRRQQPREQEPSGAEGSGTQDTVSLSAQAVALARNVPAAAAASETTERPGDLGQTATLETTTRAGTIDIRV